MLITENQLDEWVRGNSQDARGVIVELVWRLIGASCANPRERRFPLADSIGQHGPDGVLEVDLSYEPFIPEGLSYWEVGTGLRAQEKASSDFSDLSASVPESIRTESTFIFVTPLSGHRDWPYTWKEDEQASWLDSKRKLRLWKDVRIIDGTKLIDWLHQFLAVELWLTQRIRGLSPIQIEIPEQQWRITRSIGEPPPLSPTLFLANRSEATARLGEIMGGTSIQLKLSTHYPEQVVDFVSAYLAALESEEQVNIAGRCLIVSSADAWNTICQQPQWKNYILVADSSLDLNGDNGTKLIQRARRAGHAIIFGGPYGGIPDPSSAPLPMPSSDQMREALESAGYSEERARSLAIKSGGNLNSLLRCLQNVSLLPEWAERSDAADLVIALLLGSWNEKSEADRLVIESLSGKEYGEWIREIRNIAALPSTPLIQRDGNWKFISRYEGWYALGARLFDDHLDRLKDAALTVLGEKDPQFELEPEQRYAAVIHKKVLSHSRGLRNGLAETSCASRKPP